MPVHPRVGGVYPSNQSFKSSNFGPRFNNIVPRSNPNVRSKDAKTAHLLHPVRSAGGCSIETTHETVRDLITVYYCGDFDECTLPLHRSKQVETTEPCSRRGVFSRCTLISEWEPADRFEQCWLASVGRHSSTDSLTRTSVQPEPR